MRVLLVAVALCTAMLCVGSATLWCSAASAQNYSSEIVGSKLDGIGTVTYSYVVYNTSSDPDYCLWLLAISFDDSMNVVSTAQPTGWKFDDQDLTPGFMTWTCMKDGIYGSQSLGGFQAVFDGNPTFQDYTVMYSNVTTQEFPVDDGVVVFTPEPTGIVAFLLAIPSLAIFAKRRRA